MTQQDITALTEIIVSTQNQLGEQLAEFKADIDEQFKQIEQDMKSGFDKVNVTLDGIAARLDIDDSERLALTAQVDRHETWIVEAAPKVGIPYTPGS